MHDETKSSTDTSNDGLSYEKNEAFLGAYIMLSKSWSGVPKYGLISYCSFLSGLGKTPRRQGTGWLLIEQ